MASAPRVATFVLVLASIFAISLGTPQGEGARKSYIVHVVKSAKPSHFTSHHKWYASMLRQVSQSVPHATELLYTYDTVLHGFAAMLSSAEAEDMENLEGMKNNKITETNSSTLSIANSSKRWQEKLFLPTTLNGCLAIIPSSGILWNYSTYGEGIIVDVIDTGIWPESKSFSDAGLGPIPASGEHGTHVASIVAGAPVDVSSWFGNVKVRGMAPQARLTIYKACWKDGCTDADITAAIDQAIANGVDIISISISSKDVPFYKSTRAIVVFGAIKNGTLVSASGGNSGPFHLIRVTYCHGLRL
ncbi:hypothetical protein SUGI_0574820 [Cryptomeria japonica]|nr:hypothetical protein SUGI_0574820 [Cryptomeria japonica]